MRDELVTKLRPERFSAMSGRMAATVGYMLDERFSDPVVSQLVVTSDGFVLAQREVGANEMIGGEADLSRCSLSSRPRGLIGGAINESGRLQRDRIKRYGQRR